MNKNLKKSITLSALVIAWVTAVSFAANNGELEIANDIQNARQTIEKIIFSPNGIDTDSQKIVVEAPNGTVKIGGRVLMQVEGAGNVLWNSSDGSSIIEGRGNTIEWKHSIIVWGNGNTINTDNSYIIWGNTNTITWTNSIILWWNNNWIDWNTSVIIAWKSNKITGNYSFIPIGNNVKLYGDGSIAAGKNIKWHTAKTDHIFVWSDGHGGNFTPKVSNAFYINAKGWLLIWKTKPTLGANGGIEVNGSIKLGAQTNKRCNAEGLSWAIQFTNNCFCGCNGIEWQAMTPSESCRTVCTALPD